MKSNEPPTGTVLADKYELREVIGRGGFGVVYEAIHLKINRKIALKILLPEFSQKDPDLAIRFRREALLASELRHPNTITLYDYGHGDDGLLYMAMEFVNGHTLSDVLREEAPIGAERVVHITRQILGSLHEAHQRGIVHRDLKPGNIMLTKLRGDPNFVKVLDFGIAKAVSPDLLAVPDVGQTLTQEGRFCGTPRYMAPEQFRNVPVTPAVDLYSMGLIAYELLTGKPAVSGETMVDLIVAQVTGADLKIPKKVRMESAFREAFHRALYKDPDKRMQSAVEFLEALSEVVDEDEDHTVELTPGMLPFLAGMRAEEPLEENTAPVDPPQTRDRQGTRKVTPNTPSPEPQRPTPQSRLKDRLAAIRKGKVPGLGRSERSPPSSSSAPTPTPSVRTDALKPLGQHAGASLQIVRPDDPESDADEEESRIPQTEQMPAINGPHDPRHAPLDDFETTEIPDEVRTNTPNPGGRREPRTTQTPVVAATHREPPIVTMPGDGDATIDIASANMAMELVSDSDSDSTIDISTSDILAGQLNQDFLGHFNPQPNNGQERPPPDQKTIKSSSVPGPDPSAAMEAYEGDGPTLRVSFNDVGPMIHQARITHDARRQSGAHSIEELSGLAQPGGPMTNAHATPPKRPFNPLTVLIVIAVVLVLGSGCTLGVLYFWGDLSGAKTSARGGGDGKSKGEEVVLTIETKPTNAKVYANDKFKGYSPVPIKGTKGERIRLTIYKDDHPTFTSTRTFSSTKTDTIVLPKK